MAIPATYDAFSIPIGSLLEYADHTCVCAAANQVHYDFSCYGCGWQNAPAPAVLTGGGGNLHAVSYMVNGSTTLKPVYNGWGDNCGILYGVQGVCHNMSNRILMTAIGSVLPFGTVTGYTFSLILYGFFGCTATSFNQRYLNALNAAAPLGTSFSSSFSDQLEQAYTSAAAGIQALPIADSYKTALLALLQMEKDDASTPTNRISQWYQCVLGQNDSAVDTDGADNPCDVLISILKDFLPVLAPGNGAEVIHAAFKIMNQKMYSCLGDEKYKKFFCMPYQSDFRLVEESIVTDPYKMDSPEKTADS